METRKLDENATKLARQRQKVGEERLQAAFRIPYQLVRFRRMGLAMVHTRYGSALNEAPWRRQPGCPRPRDVATKARHLRRKRAHAARRASWS